MCHAVRCRVCDKTTWSRCGAHIDAVKRSVPADQWCTAHPSTETPSTRRGLFRKKR
jgi:hypothetical protein